MDDALVEKVARAIYGGDEDDWLALPDTKVERRARGYESAFTRDDFRDDARNALAIAYPAGMKEGLEMAAKACDELAVTAAMIQCTIELHGHDAPRKALQRETAEALATAIRSLGPRP